MFVALNKLNSLFASPFFKQTIRELFDVNDGEKREVAVELSVPQAGDDEGVNKQSTTILEQVRNMFCSFWLLFLNVNQELSDR